MRMVEDGRAAGVALPERRAWASMRPPRMHAEMARKAKARKTAAMIAGRYHTMETPERDAECVRGIIGRRGAEFKVTGLCS